MPTNTVCVTRPHKYGNPFKVIGDMIFGNASHRRKFLDPWIFIEPDRNDFIDWNLPSNEIVIALYENWMEGNDNNYIIPPPTREDIEKLRGKNLACFCKEGSPCHADILLKIANQ